MNHFAHAWIAAAQAPDPVLALGAMLPDFTGVLRERLGPLAHPALRAGCALHHASDAAFHGAPEFVALLSAGSASLRASGLGRGPARAAAHVGLELLLDAELAREPRAAARYAEALAAALRPEVAEAIAWRRTDTAPRWRVLHVRLCARGAPDPDEDCADLAARVARALASRRRLALGDGDPERVARWLGDARPMVRKASPGLVSAVVDAMAGRN